MISLGVIRSDLTISNFIYYFPFPEAVDITLVLPRTAAKEGEGIEEGGGDPGGGRGERRGDKRQGNWGVGLGW